MVQLGAGACGVRMLSPDGEGFFNVGDAQRKPLLPTPIPRIKGDINGDGVVDLKDLLAVIGHIFETCPLEGIALATAQAVSDNGEIDLKVLLSIVDIIFT